MVDGFHVAEEFKRHYPDGYEFLRKKVMQAEYIHTNTEPSEYVLNK